jgi:hypothetical protein
VTVSPPVPVQPKDAVRPGSAEARTRALQARQALTDKRRRTGSLPVAQQLRAAAASALLPLSRAYDGAFAVVTLAKPIPVDVYATRQPLAGGGLLDATCRVTFYVELADGYPFEVSGPPNTDLVGRLRAGMAETAAQLRARPAPGPLGSAQGKQRAKRLMLAEQIEEARSSLRERAVVLGFTIPLRVYEQIGSRLRSAYAVAAVEVEFSSYALPFKNLAGVLDRQRVAELRKEYRDAG